MIFFLLLEDIKIPLIGAREKVTHEADGLIKISLTFFFFAFKVTDKFIVKRNKFLSYIKKYLTSFPTATTSRAMIRTKSASAWQEHSNQGLRLLRKKHLGYPMRHTAEIGNQLKDEEYLE